MDWLLLRCLAEHLRIQKKIAGLDYEGAITGPHEEMIWSCGSLRAIFAFGEPCDACGAKIESEGT